MRRLAWATVAMLLATSGGCVPSTSAPPAGGSGNGALPAASRDAAATPPTSIASSAPPVASACAVGGSQPCALLAGGCETGARTCDDAGWGACVFDNPKTVPACTVQCTGGSLAGESLFTPVNRFESLRPDWAPGDLRVVPPAYRTVDPHERMRIQPLGHMIQMLEAERHAASPKIFCGSPYRSFGEQCQLFAQYAAQDKRCAKANTYSAMAGHSEHQLGSVCDMVYADNGLIQGKTAGDTWLAEHAYEYGFVQSYPEGTTDVTGYETEPWHYRYLGRKAALLHHQLQTEASRAISTHELIATIACWPAMKLDELGQEDQADADGARDAYCRASKDWSAVCQPQKP